ncbi:MAG: hypothetical protein ING89_15380 [Rubrivivax sp.]|nr:hypothetical protein [Rubrivivax sp.]
MPVGARRAAEPASPRAPVGEPALAAGPQAFDEQALWSGDESHWPARARRAWQAGEWTLLGALASQALHRHPQRARLALLAAAGSFHQGDVAATRRLVEQALGWGADRHLVARMLVAGLHNTLGRAAAVLDQPARAVAHFSASVVTAMPGSSVHAASLARRTEQLAQLGLASAEAEVPLLEGRAPGSPSVPAQARWRVGEVTARGELHGAATRSGAYQYFAYGAEGGPLQVLQRHLPSGAWTLNEPGAVARGRVDIGVDVQGHVRVRTQTSLQTVCEWRSLAPHDPGAWSGAADVGRFREPPAPTVGLDQTLGPRIVAQEGQKGRRTLLLAEPAAAGSETLVLLLVDQQEA